MTCLALGTAQFGLNYGIANKSGQVTVQIAKDMLALLQQNNIDMLDTAIAYGTSEACLGEVGVANFKIITKLPAVPEKCQDITKWVHKEIAASFSRLKVQKIYGLLLHRSDQLLLEIGKQLYGALQNLKDAGRVQKIGVSIYDPAELPALTQQYQLDIVQAPFNLVDRRLHNTGWLQRLKTMGIEVHIRSVFLQGLLLMNAKNIPAKFSPWTSLFGKWQNWLVSSNVSALQTCLQFALSFPEIDRVIIGADNLHQLKQAISSGVNTRFHNFPDISCDDEKLINPKFWL